ncbi:MAG: RNA 2',3'-cyclic phosphodiesterase [Deltaproteobacteria bacterium]|jgi:2'-5' RNA ligase
MGIRSFLAFELPGDIRSVVDRVAGEVRRSSLDVRWVKAENIHITVIFLGSVNTQDLEGIKKGAEEICLRYRPFDIALAGVGCFPNTRNPRVVWLGVEGDLDRMAPFRDDLQEKLVPFGIKGEKRPFRPHLTLGRFKKQGKSDGRLLEILSKYKELTSPVCSLNELVLFKSDLKPGGAVYTKMLSWPLSGQK